MGQRGGALPAAAAAAAVAEYTRPPPESARRSVERTGAGERSAAWSDLSLSLPLSEIV